MIWGYHRSRKHPYTCRYQMYHDHPSGLAETWQATQNLDDMLRLFTAPERLDKQNSWKCLVDDFIHVYVVVSKIVYFHPHLGRIPI